MTQTSGMKDSPKDMFTDAKQIRKAVNSLRTKSVIDDLIRRGIAPDRIERTIKDGHELFQPRRQSF